MAGPHQRDFTNGVRKMRGRLVNRATPALLRTILTVLLLLGAAGAIAQDPRSVHYTCADGTKLQATFSPLSTSPGSVKLVFVGSSSETTLPQALSADGGRYIQDDVEFWIKGEGATLTRAGKPTTCRTGG
jgi:membrane-bound inhibitor of C-type lysozyme